MAQLNLTIDLEELTEAVLNSDMKTAIKSIIIAIFNSYMEAERDEFIQAKRYQRDDQRRDYRNGYYNRDYTLSLGKLSLKVPRTRSGEFSTELFEQYERKDQTFVLSMIEMYLNGVSTRKITKIVESLCGESVSKSFVSSVIDRIDPEIEAFQKASLTHSNFRYLYVDAMYIKVREHSRVVSKALYIAQGVNDENKREIIGFMIDSEESKVNWVNFFLDLKACGLKNPKLIISDAHEGLKAAIKEVFLNTPWQRCTFHFIKNLVETMPRKNSKTQRLMLKKILHADSQQEARELKKKFEESVAGIVAYEKTLHKLDQGFEDAIQYMLEPSLFHISLRTTNSLERINKELRRRDRVIGIYPNEASAWKVLGSILIDIHESWKQSNRKFLQRRGEIK